MLEGLDTAARDFRGDLSSTLMEVIAPFRNRHFTDRYTDVSFDLSRAIFILSADSTEYIESPLKDILEVIKL
ncbi:MAG: ATP-dependent protease, partial [Nitrospirota bacterium]